MVDQTDRAELRRLVDAEREALAEMQASVGEQGADVTKLDAWLKASGKMATAARVHIPALLDELDAADLASLPCKSGEGADHVLDAGKLVEDGTELGEVQCACSEDDGVPDVGVSVGLGNGKALWIGETLLRDGSNIGVVFHGPDQQRIVAPLPDGTDWQAIGDILRHHVAPALTPDATQTREAELVRAVKDDLRGPDGEEYTDSGMENAFFRWPVIERALRAALNARGGA